MHRSIFVRRPVLVACCGAIALLAHGTARAVDGVIEINDARAGAGGVTPADTPGYPVTLDAPGSYRLTGDLETTSTNAVEVTAEGAVTLDLNGFALRGPGSCNGSGSGIICASGVGIGVKATSSVESVRIEGGAIHGMVVGVDLDVDDVILEDLVVYENQGRGIEVNGGRISGCRVERNGLDGIGIVGLSGPFLLADNILHENGEDGAAITLGSEGVFRSNVVSDNGGWGLYTDSFGSPASSPAYAGNQFRSNGDGSVRGGTQVGQNLCGASLCP